jgi:carboxyl-terminal processing protease
MMIKKKYLIPIAISLIAIGILIGLTVDRMFASNSNWIEQMNKFGQVLRLIGSQYVDDVNWEKVFSGAIGGTLEKLDPHSVYIPPKQLEQVTEDMEAKFEGIGIQFAIIDKYLVVIAPISGGPSDKVGIMSGDRIVKIEGVSAYGITEAEVMKKLRGKKGTKVNVTVSREGISGLLEFTIIRDEIPLYTVDAAYVMEDGTGVIKINRFAKNTAQEFEESLRKLKLQGMKRLVIDLRDNPGGYEEQAVNIVKLFIGERKRIVYNRGRAQGTDYDYNADEKATYPDVPLIVLIDKGSASASEIVAGAIQDWDRGLVVGTRSFGKGLVQHQYQLPDNSAIRLTVARYYTPSGRSIQKPYEDKNIVDYLRDTESDSAFASLPDSIKAKYTFKTSAGRVIYGGGGIAPDFEIKTEFVMPTQFTIQLRNKRIIYEYATAYAGKNKDMGKDYSKFLKNFEVTPSMLSELIKLAEQRGLKFDEVSFNKDTESIKRQIKAEIARYFWDKDRYDHFYEIIFTGDKQFMDAIKLFPKAVEITQLKKVNEF